MEKGPQFITEGDFIEVAERRKGNIKEKKSKNGAVEKEQIRENRAGDLLETINYKDPKEWSLTTFKAVFNYLREFGTDLREDKGSYELVYKSLGRLIGTRSESELASGISEFVYNLRDDSFGSVEFVENAMKALRFDEKSIISGEIIEIFKKIPHDINALQKALEFEPEEYNPESSRFFRKYFEKANLDAYEFFKKVDMDIKNILPSDSQLEFYKSVQLNESGEDIGKVLARELNTSSDDKSFRAVYHVMGSAIAGVLNNIQLIVKRIKNNYCRDMENFSTSKALVTFSEEVYRLRSLDEKNKKESISKIQKILVPEIIKDIESLNYTRKKIVEDKKKEKKQ